MNLETSSGTQLSWIRADRLIRTERSVLNGPIENVASPELPHHAATKGYVDQRFFSYTLTDQLDFRFQAIYAKISDLQTTDQRMLTLLRNMSPSAIPDPFAFLENNVYFLYRMSFPTETIAYHFVPIASWSFEPLLTYLDTIVSKRVLEAE